MKSNIVYLFLLIGTVLFAQDVQFNAKLSKNRLGVNERLRVDFIMNQDGDNFRAPSFEGFSVVGGPSQTTSRQWVNGKSSFSKTYSYVLSPTKRGNLEIGQAEITVGGQVYKSPPVPVTVTAAVEVPKDPNDPTYLAKEKVHLVAEVSKNSPYLNEAFTIVYKLYVSKETSVNNWRELDSPKFADFWSQSADETRNRG